MKKLEFEINMNALKEKVWNILWDKDTYNKWTSVFSPDSTTVTDWKEGSKILFLDGKGQGIASVIAKKTENEYMAFKHLGMVKDGVEDMDSEETKKWSGAMETYALKEKEGVTTLSVTMDCTEEFESYMKEVWPRALSLLKELAETS